MAISAKLQPYMVKIRFRMRKTSQKAQPEHIASNGNPKHAGMRRPSIPVANALHKHDEAVLISWLHDRSVSLRTAL